MHYITSSNPDYNGVTNLRSAPNTSSKVVGTLNTLGFKCIKEDSTGNTPTAWTKYSTEDNQSGFWIRNDVHKSTILHSNRILTTDNFYQYSDTANLSRNDCGQAALLTMMKYYKPDLNLNVDDIVRFLNLGNNFSSFKDLIMAATHYGFNPVYERPIHIPDIINMINNNKPVLVLVNNAQLYANKNYGHFVVVVGYDDNYIFLQNPEINKEYTFHKYTKFNKAIGQYQAVGNLPFQAMYFNDVLPNEEKVSTKEQITTYVNSIKNYMTEIDALLEKIKEATQ